MDASPSTTQSTLRERIVEHLFIGELLRVLWRRGVTDVEVLRSEFDAHGYDVVLTRGRIVRHIQLKTQAAGRVSVGRALAEKPSGCVVRIRINPKTLDMGPYFWFGGLPGEPLPDVSLLPNPKRTTPKLNQQKPPRVNHHELPQDVFTRLMTVEEVAERLFGELPGR